jgi:hypothetical protein
MMLSFVGLPRNGCRRADAGDCAGARGAFTQRATPPPDQGREVTPPRGIGYDTLVELAELHRTAREVGARVDNELPRNRRS